MPLLARLRGRAKTRMLALGGAKELAMLAVRGIILAALLAALGSTAAQAADGAVTVAPATSPRMGAAHAPGVVVVEPAPAVVAIPPPTPVVIVPPAVAVPDTVVVTGVPVIGPSLKPYGCQRVWRCDAQVCEWRRGCNGVYGYVEGPYYNKPLAERQWARDYLPGPESETRVVRSRARVVDPALK